MGSEGEKEGRKMICREGKDGRQREREREMSVDG